MIQKLLPFLAIAICGVLLILLGNTTLVGIIAILGQILGLAGGIPQWVQLYRTKSADDINISSYFLLFCMIASLLIQAHVTGANWIVQLNFVCSGLVLLTTVCMSAYYQTRRKL